MKLNTERLEIIPLNLEQFQLLLQGMDKLEQSLGLNFSNCHLDEHTQKAMEGQYRQALQGDSNYFWHTNWQIILKTANISIGSACFMGRPSKRGEVEIGYGINEPFRNKGYMTEAAAALYAWALNQPEVKRVIAETEKDNPASHKVLQKLGMLKYHETAKSYCWRTPPNF